MIWPMSVLMVAMLAASSAAEPSIATVFAPGAAFASARMWSIWLCFTPDFSTAWNR